MTTKGKSLVIAQELRGKIGSGELPPGTKFETIPKFAVSNGTTIATIGKVFDMLEKEGLIERRNGSGVFVKKRPSRRYAVVFDSKAEFGVFAHKAVFMKCFMEECRHHNAEAMSFENVDTENDCQQVRKAFQELSYDGVVVSSRGFAQGIEKYLRNIPIPAIGLYEYKWMKRSVTFSFSWMTDAVKRLRAAGCTRIAAVFNNEDWTAWAREGYPTASDIFRELCSDSGGTMQKRDLYCSPLSPREGYCTACRFLDSLKPGERPGMIVTDSVLTHGVISAVLQRGLTPMKDIPIISQANLGSVFSEFSLPVWTYKLDVSAEASAVFQMFQNSGPEADGVPQIMRIPLTFHKIEGDRK